jgi:hypothetical protein
VPALAGRLRRPPGRSLRATLEALDLEPWHDTSAADGQLGRSSLPQADTLIAQFSARSREGPGDWLTWLSLARLYEVPPVASAVDGQPWCGQLAAEAGAVAHHANHFILDDGRTGNLSYDADGSGRRQVVAVGGAGDRAGGCRRSHGR